MEILGWILGKLFYLSYRMAFSNYLLSVILFTFVTKVILFPVSIWTHRNGIKMVKMQPYINELKVKYFGDKDAVSDGTMALYKREKYNAFAGTIPLVIQIILLLGIVQVVKQPEMAGLTYTSMVTGSVRFYEYPFEAGGWYYLMPFLAGSSALLLSLFQNRMNPLQAEQSKTGKYGTMAVSVGISLFLGAYVQTAVGTYWIVSNLMAVLLQLLLNLMFRPKKYIDYERLEESRKRLQELEQVGQTGTGEKRREYFRREKRDYKRFFNVVNKHLVFYSERSGFYKYFEAVIEYLLANSSLTIHYVTSDPEDQIFQMEKENPRIRAYYIGEKKLITLFMKMDADMVVMTMTDLENFHYKRSLVRKDIEYVYLFHAPVSTHMIYHQGAFDHYDTLLCVGEFAFAEIRRQEELHALPPKKLIACGYGQIEKLAESYEKRKRIQNEDGKKKEDTVNKQIKTILIAPSWQEDNILDLCLDSLIQELSGKGFAVTVRPHPEYRKRYRSRLDAAVKKYQNREDLVFELEFASNTSIFEADVLITDWSGIAYEYSFVTGKPTVFIDTPVKIFNPEYEKIGIEPMEITLRDKIGIRMKPDALDGLSEKLKELSRQEDRYREQNFRLREQYIANFGHSGEAGGSYIIESIREKIRKNRTGI